MALARTFSTVLNNGECGPTCLVCDLKKKNFQLFTVKYDVSCGVVTYSFITLKYIPFIFILFGVFLKIMN